MKTLQGKYESTGDRRGRPGGRKLVLGSETAKERPGQKRGEGSLPHPVRGPSPPPTWETPGSTWHVPPGRYQGLPRTCRKQAGCSDGINQAHLCAP